MGTTFRRDETGIMVRFNKQLNLMKYLIAGKRNEDVVLLQLAARGAQRAREHTPRRTGRLAGSMRFTFGTGQKTYNYRFLVTGETMQGIIKGLGRHTAVFGTDVPYAPYVEWGTRKMAGRAMLRAAADDVRHRVALAHRNIISSKKIAVGLN